MHLTAQRLEATRDQFRKWYSELPVCVLARNQDIQKLITQYERHLSVAIEILRQH